MAARRRTKRSKASDRTVSMFGGEHEVVPPAPPNVVHLEEIKRPPRVEKFGDLEMNALRWFGRTGNWPDHYLAIVLGKVPQHVLMLSGRARLNYQAYQANVEAEYLYTGELASIVDVPFAKRWSPVGESARPNIFLEQLCVEGRCAPCGPHECSRKRNTKPAKEEPAKEEPPVGPTVVKPTPIEVAGAALRGSR